MTRALLASAVVAALAIGIVANSTPKEGCGAMCCCRPEGAAVESCLRRNPNTGEPEDFGELNAMPFTHAVGAGCVPHECVVGEGIRSIDGGMP